MRKTGREIGFGVAKGTIGADETFEWLSSATAQELQEYIRGVGSLSPTWSAFGRDALNVVLANENIKLQNAIKKLTIWILILTFIMTVSTFYQIYRDFIKTNYSVTTTTNTKTTITDSTLTNNQPNKATQPENEIKTNHKGTPNK
jgi:hypothetical protein